jgi:hypothetical protein
LRTAVEVVTGILRDPDFDTKLVPEALDVFDKVARGSVVPMNRDKAVSSGTSRFIED